MKKTILLLIILFSVSLSGSAGSPTQAPAAAVSPSVEAAQTVSSLSSVPSLGAPSAYAFSNTGPITESAGWGTVVNAELTTVPIGNGIWAIIIAVMAYGVVVFFKEKKKKII